jgi:hypothetical protein
MTGNNLETVYITRFTFHKILKTDAKALQSLGLNASDLPGKVGNVVREGKKTILSEYENRWLLCLNVMYESFSIYVDKIFTKIQGGKRKKYIIEVNPPKYHITLNCNGLGKILENPYLLPKEISDEQQDEFCIWFNQNQKLFERNLNTYIEGLWTKFGIKCNSLPEKGSSKNNSGKRKIINASEDQLKKHIDRLIDDVLSIYKKDTFTRKTIDTYGDETNNLKKLSVNEDEYNILIDWDNRKKELKDTIINYFQVKFNPNLEFDKKLLDGLDFQPCKFCSR